MNTSLGRSISIAVAIAAGAGLMLGASGALADVFVQNSDHCTAVCTIDTNNTVTVTQTAANTLEMVVQLDSGWHFVQTGSHQSFDFSLNGISSLLENISASTSDLANWAFLNSVGTLVTGAASLMDDGLTIPASAYALNHTTSGNNVDGDHLDFTITASGLTLASFNQLVLNSGGLSGSFFAADVLAQNGATGVIDFADPVPGPVLGAGLPGLIAACGSLIALGRRRRRNAA